MSTANAFQAPDGDWGDRAEANQFGYNPDMDKDPPWPLIEIAVEPRTKADGIKLGVALSDMVLGDPSLSVIVDEHSGQTILAGSSELHLDRAIGTLIEDRDVGVNIGSPQVAYRETLGGRVEIDHIYRRQSGESGQFARVRLLFEPGERGSGFRFETRADGSLVPESVPGILKGLEAARANGLLAGFPVIDFRATLMGGAYHDTDSTALAFEVAARDAFRELRQQGQPRLLEPIMIVCVSAPAEFVSDITGDLGSRRGEVLGVQECGDARTITALAPLANMFGYADNLRGMCEGRADFTMEYDHYREVETPSGHDPDLFPPAVGMRA